MKINCSQKSLLLVLSMMVLFSTVEFYVHFKSGSLILLGHLMHCFYDLLGILIALFGATFINSESNDIKSFGYYRYVILAALLNSLFLLIINIKVLSTGLISLFSDNHIHSHDHLLAISILGLLVNFISFLALHNKANDLNNRVVLLHIIRDFFTSLIAIFVAVSSYYFDVDLLDSLGSILISLMLVFGTLSIAKKCIHILCNGTPYHISSDKIKQSIKDNFPSISDAHHIHVWYLTEHKFISSMHVILNENHPDFIEKLNKFLFDNYGIVHNTVQIENRCVENNYSCAKGKMLL